MQKHCASFNDIQYHWRIQKLIKKAVAGMQGST